MKKKGKIILWAVVVAAVCAVVLIPLLGGSGKKGQIVFETAVATRSDIASSVTATGTIEPVTEVEVGTQVSGIIDRIYVDYNSVVRKGQLIAEMDMSTLKTDLQSARASYQGNKAEYDYQEKIYNRNKALYEKDLISDVDFEESEYNYLRAKSSLMNSEAELARAERELSYATITSPIDGVVIDRSVEEGQTVAAGFETPTLFTIAADLTKMQVVADVDEADIGGVEEGQRVSFTVDAYPDDVFEGRVEQIRLGSTESSSSATTTESVVTYEVVISADNPDLKLKPRLTANIEIYVIDRRDVLSVPSRALRFEVEAPLLSEGDVVKDCQGEDKVWTRSGNVFTAIPVQTGISNGSMTEIVGGLAEGTEVLTGVQIASAGKAVKGPAAAERSPFAPGPPGRNKDSEK